MRNVCDHELHIEREMLSEDNRKKEKYEVSVNSLRGECSSLHLIFILFCVLFFFKGTVTVHKYMMFVLVFY